MGVFMYYLPGIQKAGKKELAEFGLTDRFEPDDPVRHAPVLANGPDGNRGMIVAFDPPGRKHPLGYYPDRQTWQQVGDYYIGFDNHDRPDPQIHERKTVLAGHEVELGGHKWIVPVLRHFWPEQGTPLPQVFTLDSTGKMVKVVDKKYRELCENADRLWYTFCELFDLSDCITDIDAMEPLTEEDRFLNACKALAINYRITREEILATGMIDTLKLFQIEKALFDWPTVEKLAQMTDELEKKNIDRDSTQDSSGSGDGQGANCPDTSPPGENSS